MKRRLSKRINHIDLHGPDGSGPLDLLLKHYYRSTDIRRLKFLDFFFAPFHLKNAVIHSVQGRKISINDREVINFTSCNYLGLEMDSRVHEAAIEGLKTFGNHAGCSRIFASQADAFKLEVDLANLVGAEKALLGVNTAQLHQGVIPALFSNSLTEIFIDKYAHTSLYQASLTAKAKGAKITRVDISLMPNLRKQIRRSQKRYKVLLVDGVYSMSGEIPDLKLIQQLCMQSNTTLYIDDAHGIGMYGKKGGGVVEELGLNFENLILTGSLQKALGCYGSFVAGRSDLIDLLRVSAKSYIFSGPIQPQAVAGSRKALEICLSSEGQSLRAKVKAKSVMIREELAKMGYTVTKGNSPIISVTVGGDIRTLMAGRKLYDMGIYVNSVLYPAVSRGAGILRISVTALHNVEDIELLLESFQTLKKFWFERKTGLKENLSYFKDVAKAKIQGSTYLGL